MKKRKIRKSKLAHQYLDRLKGIEIGGSAHNSFGLNTINVDYTDEFTVFKQEELRICGEYMQVDVVSRGDKLPFPDEAWDFVLSSHVIEHFFDPMNTIKEWLRVIKKGGYLFMIIPHKERTFDCDREITTLQELIDRHKGKIKMPEDDIHMHYCVWDTQAFLELCEYMNLHVVAYQHVDDKVGNGFTVVIQKSFFAPEEMLGRDNRVPVTIF